MPGNNPHLWPISTSEQSPTCLHGLAKVRLASEPSRINIICSDPHSGDPEPLARVRRLKRESRLCRFKSINSRQSPLWFWWLTLIFVVINVCYNEIISRKVSTGNPVIFWLTIFLEMWSGSLMPKKSPELAEVRTEILRGQLSVTAYRTALSCHRLAQKKHVGCTTLPKFC
jgi:hypothetical protein